ncbi:M48 family metallopeptidase [Alkalibacter rhizosphaerae]|uniref:M48 family metallopeptidase n=1 Tax=Alkalibacter rhizosphaerae TaxID=2815577 RepID=A0A974XFN0_9FIRM|nr:SprT family zinc-dependent metalloprotease [Alkalibacter rhizosphaerae]QSX08876.1 M48 family metallopeptidase [Alkalibacter rhizosphaerae]
MKVYTTKCGEAIVYDWICRRRKTAELRIDPRKGLQAITPMGWTQKQLETLLEKKKKWILSHIQRMKLQEAAFSSLSEQRNDQLLYRGRWYPIQRETGPHRKPKVDFTGGAFFLWKGIDTTRDEERAAIVAWFKVEAQQLLEERVQAHAPKIAGSPKMVKAKEQKKRWGSCTHDDRLLFNWRLALAPPEVLDSVVVHELCHMVHKNHSKEFWNLLDHHHPDYGESKKWLKNNGHLLFWLD